MEVYLGAVMNFGFNFAPKGWQLCNGQLLNLAQNQALFALLGVTYGGNGIQSFALPNLQSRIPASQGNGGGGLSTLVMGEVGGTENTSVLIGNLASHTHAATFSTVGAGYMASTNTIGNKLSPSTANNVLAGSPPGVDAAAIWATSTPAPTIPLGGGGTGGTVTNANTGGNVPIAIMNPYLALNFSIAMQGIFPSRN